MVGACEPALVMRLILAGSLLCWLSRTGATTLTNELFLGWTQYSVALNAGDTMVWVNQPSASTDSNYLASYGGEWQSPPLAPSDSFAFTFTNAGFYAYRTGMIWKPGLVRCGTVTVYAWSGAPPAVTMNMPVDGATVPSHIVVQASVPNEQDLAQIDFFSNGSLIGTATNAPYTVALDTGPVCAHGSGSGSARDGSLVAAGDRHRRPPPGRLEPSTAADG